jgi:hypothetical protein
MLSMVSEEQHYEVEVEKNVLLIFQDGTILYSHFYYPISVEKFPSLKECGMTRKVLRRYK